MGGHARNRMVFKQLLQAEAIDVVQIDSCRLAGVSEVLSVLLMAAKSVFSPPLLLPVDLPGSFYSQVRRPGMPACGRCWVV